MKRAFIILMMSITQANACPQPECGGGNYAYTPATRDECLAECPNYDQWGYRMCVNYCTTLPLKAANKPGSKAVEVMLGDHNSGIESAILDVDN